MPRLQRPGRGVRTEEPGLPGLPHVASGPGACCEEGKCLVIGWSSFQRPRGVFWGLKGLQ